MMETMNRYIPYLLKWPFCENIAKTTALSWGDFMAFYGIAVGLLEIAFSRTHNLEVLGFSDLKVLNKLRSQALTSHSEKEALTDNVSASF